jgi:hypothetical protein
MFYIIETDTQLERLQSLGRLGGYVDIVPTNYYYHPKLTSTVAVYLRPINSKHGFIIPIDHEEGLNVDKERVYELLKAYTSLYTLDKKYLLYHFNLQGATDLSLLYSMVKFDKLDYSRDFSFINSFYNKFKNTSITNKLIPIPKLYEACEKIYEIVKDTIQITIPHGFDFYNKTATNVFYLLEQSGLGIHTEQFVEMFTPRELKQNTVDDVTYTYYNLYNITSRPTNAFNSVNYAAIPKTEKHRKSFKPQNDFFVEFDFDGYHVRLLCEQLGYELTDESAHMQLAKKYFKKEVVGDEEYSKAKQINFHALYGRIPEEYKDVDIFVQIQKFINSLWIKYEALGEVENPVSNKPFTEELKDMNPQKLMNYLMQSLETSRNILILKDVLRYLQNKKTKVVLYTYDSLLFDFNKEDGKDTLEELQTILESGKKYPVKFKYSKDLCL